MGQEPASGTHTSAYVRKLCRRHWRTEFIIGGSKTADIIRTTITDAGNPSRGIAPTTTTVSGLSGLNVAVGHTGLYDAQSREQDFVRLRENQREFAFLDIPATTGVSASTLQLSDFIVYDGKRWQPIRVWNDTDVGISRAVCELYDR